MNLFSPLPLLCVKLHLPSPATGGKNRGNWLCLWLLPHLTWCLQSSVQGRLLLHQSLPSSAWKGLLIVLSLENLAQRGTLYLSLLCPQSLSTSLLHPQTLSLPLLCPQKPHSRLLAQRELVCLCPSILAQRGPLHPLSWHPPHRRPLRSSPRLPAQRGATLPVPGLTAAVLVHRKPQ